MSKAYLSIDFEDFSYDFKRTYRINADSTIRTNALWRSYEAIENFCQMHMSGLRLTFFCTGIIAVKCPEIIVQISKDGHEIACHYYYHDLACNDRPLVFQENLYRAVDALECASGQKVLGFRAPNFSLSMNDIAHYHVLEKIFIYDSTLSVAKASEIYTFRKVANLHNLSLLPVVHRKILAGLLWKRSGGTFLKLLPVASTLKTMREGKDNGVIPIVYMHPYEFLCDRSFFVPMDEMEGFSLKNKLYWTLRQTQWHVLNNRSVRYKLSQIFKEYEAGGPIQSLFRL